MTTTTYYNLNIVEGTDIVNPLTVDNPNYEKIDEEMHNNAVAGVTLATEIANATVHAITRENSDCSVIRFIATSRWKAGDTATVDGVPVTALLPSGETLPDGAYVINANVLCILTGTNLTFYVGGKKVENASDIVYNDTNVEAELNELNGNIVQINSNLIKVSYVTQQVKVGSTNNASYGGYYAQGDIPTLANAGIEGTLIGTPIIASYADSGDYNIECNVKMNPSSGKFVVVSNLASRTINVYFVLLYI